MPIQQSLIALADAAQLAGYATPLIGVAIIIIAGVWLAISEKQHKEG
ncbi:MAG: hypothetical protein HGB35_00130 [Geobacteraceae bacterium]|nr:hypothetical protein [Geobacteraceae bacterium]